MKPYRCTQALYEDGVTYRIGATIELTDERAAALGSSVEPLSPDEASEPSVTAPAAPPMSRQVESPPAHTAVKPPKAPKAPKPAKK